MELLDKICAIKPKTSVTTTFSILAPSIIRISADTKMVRLKHKKITLGLLLFSLLNLSLTQVRRKIGIFKFFTGFFIKIVNFLTARNTSSRPHRSDPNLFLLIAQQHRQQFQAVLPFYFWDLNFKTYMNFTKKWIFMKIHNCLILELKRKSSPTCNYAEFYGCVLLLFWEEQVFTKEWAFSVKC